MLFLNAMASQTTSESRSAEFIPQIQSISGVPAELMPRSARLVADRLQSGRGSVIAG
jgi:hypothetical protein